MAAGKPERAEGWGCGLILLGPHTGNHHWCGPCARKTSVLPCLPGEAPDDQRRA